MAALRRLMATGRRAADVFHDDAHNPPASDDPRQEAQTQRLVRGVLRRVSLLDELLTRPGKYDPRKTPVSSQWLLRLAAFETIFQDATPDYAIGSEAVDLARAIGGERVAKFINAMVRHVLPTLPKSAEELEAAAVRLPPEIRWSVPRPILDALEAGYGTHAFASVLPQLAGSDAPVWLRVNALKTTPGQARDTLAAAGVSVEPSPFLPEALLWTGGTVPWKTEAWLRGELTVQDFAAMLATRLLSPHPGDSVLDACAAPGGKAGHLFEMMNGRGRLVAEEIDASRRSTMARALIRLYGSSHAIEIPDQAGLGQVSSFDRVLLDVPCLALGLIGRHPEIRWDGRLRHLGDMAAKQRQLLHANAARVRPGGRLLWITCSPTRAENEMIIEPWLSAACEWRKIDPASVLADELVGLLSIQDGFVRTRPDCVACDAFAMVLLERVSAS